MIVNAERNSGPRNTKRSREGGPPQNGCATLKKRAKRGPAKTGSGREQVLVEGALDREPSEALEEKGASALRSSHAGDGGLSALFLKHGDDGREKEVTFLIMNQYVVPPWSTERTQAAVDVTRKLCGRLGLLGNITIAKAGYNAKVSGGYEMVSLHVMIRWTAGGSAQGEER